MDDLADVALLARCMMACWQKELVLARRCLRRCADRVGYLPSWTQRGTGRFSKPPCPYCMRMCSIHTPYVVHALYILRCRVGDRTGICQ